MQCYEYDGWNDAKRERANKFWEPKISLNTVGKKEDTCMSGRE